MKISRLQSYWVNYRFKKELLSFLPFFILFWYYIYQIPFKNPDTGLYEKSLDITGFIAIFPAAILSSIIVLLLSSRTSKWLKSMMKLVVLMARIDGKVSKKDEKVIVKNLDNQFGYYRVKKAIKYFYEFEKTEEIDLVEACIELTQLLATKDMTMLVSFLVDLSVSDQFLSIKEEELLNEICKRLGVSSRSLELILGRKRYISEFETNRRKNKKKSFVSSINGSYQKLGLSATATMDEVKKAYRELAKIYHPDKVRNPKLKDQAKIQFQVITVAYETIKEKAN